MHRRGDRPNAVQDDPASGCRLETVVTFLQMDRPSPSGDPFGPAGRQTLMTRLVAPSLRTYRDLIDRVGRAWHWVDMMRLADDDLRRRLRDPRREIHALLVDDAASGMVEIFHESPALTEIVYLGLIPEAIGQGLGRSLLGRALTTAWARRPSRVVVRTCTLDHPAALPLYLSSGFRVIDRQVDTVVPLTEAERLAALESREAARHPTSG